MTPLRQRMLDAMVLRGFAQRTQWTYVTAVKQLARYHDCSPALLSDQQIQAYLLHLLQERHRSRSTVNTTSCAIRFLVCDVLGQTERRVKIPLGRIPQRLPELLSRAEVAALLGAPMPIKARTFLMTAYASGLRLSELCHLRGCDIDSAPDRMCIRVVQGKGAKDRYSLLTPELLDQLRLYWRTCRPGAKAEDWLFAIDNLFACTAQTLTQFAASDQWMGSAHGTPAFSLVLHTWTQDLATHVHLHAVMACGVLAKDGQWSAPARQPGFLFPVHALSRVFQGKFMAALANARQAGKIERDPQGEAPAWRERHRQLYQHDWVVYAKTPLGGPAQVLEYLSRYTHRTAISNERISSVGQNHIAFKVRADAHGGKRTVRLPGVEFVRRVLQHVLPSGLKRIRHYGVLASSCKAVKLSAARLALQMPVIDPGVVEPVKAFMARVANLDVERCPCCGTGRLHVSAALPGARQLPAPGTTAVWPQGRGPP